MSTDDRTNDQLREVIRSNMEWISRTENDETLSRSKRQMMIDGMQSIIDEARAELSRRRASGEYRKHEKVNVADRVWEIMMVVYAVVVIGAVALAPFTGGRSLAALAALIVVAFIHGLLHVLFS